MLQRVSSGTGLQAQLARQGIVKSYWARRTGPGYADIVPEFRPGALRALGVRGPLHAGGKGFTRAAAAGSCAGEIIERLSLKGPAVKGRRRTIRLGRLFSPRMRRLHGLPAALETTVIRMRAVRGKSWREFPAFLVQLGRPGDLRVATSVGTAFARSARTAIRHALLECIERHAILRAWYIGEPLAAVSNIPRRLQARARGLGADAQWYAANSGHGMPVYLCTIRWEGRTVFGSACHPRAGRALRAAFLEALQLRESAGHLGRPRTRLERRFGRLLRQFPFALSQEACKAADFPIARALRIPAYYALITHPAFASNGSVARVIAPRLLQQTAPGAPIFCQNEQLARRHGKHDIPFV